MTTRLFCLSVLLLLTNRFPGMPSGEQPPQSLLDAPSYSGPIGELERLRDERRGDILRPQELLYVSQIPSI